MALYKFFLVDSFFHSTISHANSLTDYRSVVRLWQKILRSLSTEDNWVSVQTSHRDVENVGIPRKKPHSPAVAARLHGVFCT